MKKMVLISFRLSRRTIGSGNPKVVSDACEIESIRKGAVLGKGNGTSKY